MTSEAREGDGRNATVEKTMSRKLKRPDTSSRRHFSVMEHDLCTGSGCIACSSQ
ncbi:hypothetical protein PAXRUDRAFT_821297 [Paxillus rubicundulus Ve08.2h10]|uniref:Uncharacterized protein n=1 Tax=Paxillus rubicundulus Ve08.2h10 TaxID=930991 RepID=A0A0D0EAZ3_9AGAM|nr:hypothetical protein PAXRUDRAFT_821297 [Paxillus rubicundulus Ve08.2h10]